MKKIVLLFLLLPGLTLALPKQADYPHWNFKNRAMYRKLAKIDNFIEANKDKGYAAVFDWDGTLYNEEIKLKKHNKENPVAGEISWEIWAAHHLHDRKCPNIFPLYRAQDGNTTQHILRKIYYLINRTNVAVYGYNKYSQLATLYTGMTPTEMACSINRYLKQYPAKNEMFYPIMDLMQRMVDEGFSVWVVTASNPYYLSVVLKNIEQTVNYSAQRKYHFGISTVPYNIDTGHIVGNVTMLSADGKFTVVYDNRYFPNTKKLYIVDGKGKALTIKNYIEKKIKRPVLFYAGNSGGDYHAVQYVLKNGGKKALIVAVSPYGTLRKLVKKHSKQIVVVPVL